MMRENGCSEESALTRRRKTVPQRCQMTAAILHELNETVGQLTNAVCLLEPQRIVGNQFTTHAERAGSRYDEFLSGLLVHASSRNQGNVRKRLLENPDIGFAAYRSARKYFHEIGPRLPGVDHFGRRERRRPHRDFLF